MMVTDEAAHYKHLAADFAGHEIVRHSKNEYGRGVIHTNTIEGYFSIFKRGMKGIYQHCSEKASAPSFLNYRRRSGRHQAASNSLLLFPMCERASLGVDVPFRQAS